MVRLFDCLGKRWAQIIGSFEKPGGPRNWDSIVISFFTGGGGGYKSSLSLLSIKEWAYDFAKSAYIVSGGRSLSFALFYLACRRHIIQALSKDDWEE